MVTRPLHLWLADLVEAPSQRLSEVRPPSYMCGLRLMALRSIEDLTRVTKVFLFVDQTIWIEKALWSLLAGFLVSMIRTSQAYTWKRTNNLTIFSFDLTSCAKLDFDCISRWSFESVRQETISKVANIKARCFFLFSSFFSPRSCYSQVDWSLGLIGLRLENDLLAVTSAQRMEGNQNLAHIKKSSSSLTQSINVVSISHLICHVTIFFLKVLNNWQTSNGFEERNQAITFFSLVLNICNTQSQRLLRDFAKYSQKYSAK